MIRPGEVLTNPVSGERVRFIRTTADTDGAFAEWEHILAPGARVPTDHVHTLQQERFTVLDGTGRIRIGRDQRTVGPGDELVVDPGVAHGIYNHDPQRELRLRCQLTPALGIERYFAAVFALASAGQVNSKGLPSPLRLAPIAIEHAPGTYQAGIPVALQRVALAVAATLGRRLP